MINPILKAIQAISDEARRCLLDTEMSRAEQISTLETLIDNNHSHLVTLGVGHAALEVVKRTTMEQPWGLHTKLTGAGGGGCAVTIIPDGTHRFDLIMINRALIKIPGRFRRVFTTDPQDRFGRCWLRDLRDNCWRVWIWNPSFEWRLVCRGWSEFFSTKCGREVYFISST